MFREKAMRFLKRKEVQGVSVIRRNAGDLLNINFSGGISLLVGFDEADERVKITAIGENGETRIYLNQRGKTDAS